MQPVRWCFASHSKSTAQSPVPTRNLIGPDRGDLSSVAELPTDVRVRRGTDQWGRRTPGAIRRSNDSRSGRDSWPSYEVWRRAVPYAFQLRPVGPPDATERNVYAARRSYR